MRRTDAALVVAAVLLAVIRESYTSISTLSNLSAPVFDDGQGTRNLMQGSNRSLERCLKDWKIQYVGNTSRQYDFWRSRIHNGRYLNRTPAYFILPNTELQLQSTVICLVQAGMPFVVRNGGHSYRGMSTINCGAVIDTNNLAKITVNKRARTAWVDAGVRLGALYRTLWRSGRLIFPAGKGPSVGLSGNLLSGGSGTLTRALSVGSDSVLAARVVLPNGTAVLASNSSNPDLLFALRGGSGSYGVVSSWQLQLYPAPKVMTALYLQFNWDIQTLRRVINLLFQAQPWMWPSRVAEVRLYAGWRYTVPFRLQIIFWGTKAELQAFVSNTTFFEAAKPYNVTLFAERTYVDQMLDAAAFGEDRGYTLNDIKDMAVNTSGGVKSAISAYLPGASTGAADVLADVIFNQVCAKTHVSFLGGATSQPPRGATAYDVHRREAALIHISSTVCRPLFDSELFVRTAYARLAPFASGTQYVGYMYDVPPSQDPFTVFFGSNAGVLQGIKRKFDSANRMAALRFNGDENLQFMQKC